MSTPAGCVLTHGLCLTPVVCLQVNEQFTTYTATDVAEGLQNFLICVEMFVAALAHTYAFPPRDYMDPNIPTKGFFTNVRYMFDLRDVVVDVQGEVDLVHAWLSVWVVC